MFFLPKVLRQKKTPSVLPWFWSSTLYFLMPIDPILPSYQHEPLKSRDTSWFTMAPPRSWIALFSSMRWWQKRKGHINIPEKNPDLSSYWPCRDFRLSEIMISNKGWFALPHPGHLYTKLLSLEDVVPVPAPTAEGHVRQRGDQRPELEVPQRSDLHRKTSKGIGRDWKFLSSRIDG